MPVAANLIRVTRPSVIGGEYLAVSGSSAFTTAVTELYAYFYEGGVYQEDVASVTLSPAESTFSHRNIARTINRIHVDSAGLVEGGSLAFTYRSASATWQIAVWDVEGLGGIDTFAWTGTFGISGPVYAAGWLWYFRVAFPALQLRKIRCDLSSDTLVREETITSQGPYTDDGNLAYMALGGGEAAASRDQTPLDMPVFPLDGSPANMTPGRGSGHGAFAGIPLPDGRSVFALRPALNDVAAFAVSPSPGGRARIWPTGWDAVVDYAAGGALEGWPCCSVPPAGDAVVVYPVRHTSEPSGTSDPRQIVRTDLETTYIDSDPVPYETVEIPPSTGFIPFAMLARR